VGAPWRVWPGQELSRECEAGALENRYRGDLIVGSNPTPSAPLSTEETTVEINRRAAPVLAW
jgi:hypothetical protein